MSPTTVSLTSHFQADPDLNWEGYRPEQLVFVDETAKDERTVQRMRGWGMKGVELYQDAIFVRGERWSALAAVSWTSGMLCYSTIADGFDTEYFLEVINTV